MHTEGWSVRGLTVGELCLSHYPHTSPHRTCHRNVTRASGIANVTHGWAAVLVHNRSRPKHKNCLCTSVFSFTQQMEKCWLCCIFLLLFFSCKLKIFVCDSSWLLPFYENRTVWSETRWPFTLTLSHFFSSQEEKMSFEADPSAKGQYEGQRKTRICSLSHVVNCKYNNKIKWFVWMWSHAVARMGKQLFVHSDARFSRHLGWIWTLRHCFHTYFHISL